MRRAENVIIELASVGGSDALLSALPRYLNEAPEWLDVDADIWNVAPLNRSVRRKKTNLNLSAILNADLREVVRVYLLSLIVDRRLGDSSLSMSYHAILLLSCVMQSRPISTLKTEDFYVAESAALRSFSSGTAYRYCSILQTFAYWLSLRTGVPLSYKSRIGNSQNHGRRSSEDDRAEKRVPDEVIADIVALWASDDLNERDRFGVAVFAIGVATGFRIGELTTLPADCLIREGDAFLVRNIASKNGREAPRSIPSELAEIVKAAVEYLGEVTTPARRAAQRLAENPPLDWSLIINSPDSRNYFVRRWLSDWIDNPDNRLIDRNYVYYVPRGSTPRWLPLGDLLEKNNGNKSAVSRAAGINRNTLNTLIMQLEASQRGEVYLNSKASGSRRGFDTDRRFPSIHALLKLMNLHLGPGAVRVALDDLLDEARKAMLDGIPFNAPGFDPEFEDQYRFNTQVLKDPDTGNEVLGMHEALLVIFEGQLSEAHATKNDRVVHYSASHLTHWLSGYTRDLGTGKSTDALCARFGICDPRTGETAKLTIHDLRHWISTAYENGGLTPVQIATLFNRKSPSANSIYNQTSVASRRERLKDALKEGRILGHAAQAYAQIAEESPDEARAYLKTATKFYNPMPHGVCTLNWALEPCPHALSCFSCGEAKSADDEPCEHLIIDPEDPYQVAEVERISENAATFCKLLSEMSGVHGPQYKQYKKVERSTASLLKRMGSK
ncbi:MAG: hypothetical protein ACU0E9_12115 [Limimaricola soesokkakensis]|uniref:hypothetical protein n=1 Tax=Limimaricola soesokkakensis TaxID=1343159 RepID=UPI004058625F